MSRAQLSSVILASVGLLSACGGGGPTTPQYSFPDEASFCDALGLAECNTLVVQACYGSDDTTLEDDRARCETARAAKCNPKKLPYHPEHAEDCIFTRKAGIEDAVWTHPELDAVEAACAPVFSKEGPDGAVCTTDDDCDTANDLHCVVKLGSLQGVCGVPKEAAGGEDCSDPLSVCAAGFYCSPKVVHCLAQANEGEACADAEPCASDYYCSAPEAGSCVLKTKNGLMCTEDRLCAGGFCLGATASVDGICSATQPLQLSSATCDTYR